MESGPQLNHGYHNIEAQAMSNSDTMCHLVPRERSQHDDWRTVDELSNTTALIKEYEESLRGQQQPSAAPAATPPAAPAAANTPAAPAAPPAAPTAATPAAGGAAPPAPRPRGRPRKHANWVLFAPSCI